MSLYGYNRKFLRKDGNAIAALAFAALTAPAAYGFADFALASAETEAAIRNNVSEHTL